MEEREIGKITHYFGHLDVGIIELSDALKVGDKIRIKGHTSDFTQDIKSMQIEHAKNTDDVWLFMSYLPHHSTPASYDDVPLQALLPAFMLSELKTAFLIGFQIYLPFLILDMVVASVMVSSGMLMVPPVMVSLPFKLLLFVLVDGWHLVVGMLLQSFQAFT